MMASFNLIDQAWIPCITLDGTLVELGLRDLLHEAPRLRRLHCEVPVMNSGIMPILQAILHRVVGPTGMKTWQALWNRKAFPTDALDAYFEHWYDRFDLFHPARPFYQQSDERAKPRSVIHLIQSIGNTGTLFTHEDETVGMRMTPATAARHLVTAQLFRTAGLSGMDEKFTDGTFTRGVLFWAQGQTLYETLMLNLFAYPQDNVLRWTDADAPAWEMNDPYQARTVPNGYLDYLTWQSKRILLLPEGDENAVTVSSMTVAPGLAIAQDVISPQKRYIKRQKEAETTWSFLYFNEQKALWRDYHSLLPYGSDDEVRPPYVVQWLSHVGLQDGYPLRLLAAGMLADQAKPIFYRHEELPLPLGFLRDGAYRSMVSTAIAAADTTAEKLRGGVNILADNVLMRGGSGKPDSADRAALTTQWDTAGLYWAALEPHFWTFVSEVAAGSTTAEQQWIETLEQTAKDALAHAEQMAGSAPWALKGGVLARRYLNKELRRLFPTQERGA